MANYYLDSKAIQPPIDIGTDPEKRAMFSCNFRFRTKHVLEGLFESDIVTLCTSEVPYLTANPGRLFYGSRATIPTGTGPFVLIKATGGTESSFTHDNRSSDPLTCQITVYGASYDGAKSLADTIHKKLNGRRNFSV